LGVESGSQGRSLRLYVEVDDRDWLAERISGGFGAGPLQARRGALIDVLAGEGLVAEHDGAPVGVVLWHDDGEGSTELTYLWAFERGGGIGRALVTGMLERVGLPIWVVTTNDNVDALRFYQRLGFRLRTLRIGAVDDARENLKPSIPVERDGIAIHDELELVLENEPRS
jgi:GNAT superfamily N-acetyltransferase